MDFLAENLPERGSSPEPPQSSHGTEAVKTDVNSPCVSYADDGTLDLASHRMSPPDTSSRIRPPVGFEPATCGLQNRCSTN